MNGALYRGSKPVMWSVVEKTALAEAEVEYHDYTSDQIWVKFPVDASTAQLGMRRSTTTTGSLASRVIVIWTTTPWTIPATARSASRRRSPTASIEVTEAPEGNWAKVGDGRSGRASWPTSHEAGEGRQRGTACAMSRPTTLQPSLARIRCAARATTFDVPCSMATHVTDDDGTGFVHTAPGHGREDFDIWTANGRSCASAASTRRSPSPSTPTASSPRRRRASRASASSKDKGDKGDANDAVIKALADAGMMVARGAAEASVSALLALEEAGHLPQHAAVVHRHGQASAARRRRCASQLPNCGDSAATARCASSRCSHRRDRMGAGGGTEPHLRGMIEARPDWVISRQRAWGVPITVFVHKETGAGDPVGQVPELGRADGAHPQGHRPRAAPTPGSRRARRSAS